MALTYTRMSNIDNIWSATVTGTDNIAEVLAPGVDWRVKEIRLHLSTNGGDNEFTVTLDANAGSAYDVVELKQDMTVVTDFIETYESNEKRYHSNDKLVFDWINVNSVKYGLEVIFETLS